MGLHVGWPGCVISGMTRYAYPLLIATVVGAVALWAQKAREVPPPAPSWEVKELLPQETSPARYRQVPRFDVDALARDGWELVAVTPYVYLNEERGNRADLTRPMVTQTYPAYYFKRLKRDRF